MKWNRGTDDPRIGLLYRTETSSPDEKHHAFEQFYKVGVATWRAGRCS
jgi:hypothetical protein